MKRYLPIFLVLAACTAFEPNHDGATTADGGTGSSSSGAVAPDASSDGPAVVDAGTCLKIAPFTQNFAGGELGDWLNTPGAPGATTTTFVKNSTGGKDKDGSLSFGYTSDGVNPRRNVVAKALPNTARCFELAVDFKVSNVANEGPVFAQVRFQNDHLIGLALDSQLHLILGQQDPSSADGGASGGAGALEISDATIDANIWHTAVLRLELLTRSFTATATVDGSITLTSKPNALVEFDYTKSVEIGVDYAFASASGEVEIDRVAFQ
jgi:hypothetical protein